MSRGPGYSGPLFREGHMNLKHGTKYMRNTKTGVIFPFNQFAANNANIEVFVHTDKGV